jgi:predicted anti-sigma-YlaC factor YlaD
MMTRWRSLPHSRPHLSEDALQAWFDGEVDEVDASRIDAHLRGCASCRTTMTIVRHRTREVASLLGAIAIPQMLRRGKLRLAHRREQE